MRERSSREIWRVSVAGRGTEPVSRKSLEGNLDGPRGQASQNTVREGERDKTESSGGGGSQARLDSAPRRHSIAMPAQAGNTVCPVPALTRMENHQRESLLENANKEKPLPKITSALGLNTFFRLVLMNR